MHTAVCDRESPRSDGAQQQELLWLLRQSLIPLPHGECVWDVNAEVTDTGRASQTLEQDGSQKWKAMGDRYDHRHQLERFVIHGKNCLCSLKVTWRWSFFNDTELWANKRVNPAPRS